MTIQDLIPSTSRKLDWFFGVKRPKGAFITRSTGRRNPDPSVNHFRVSGCDSANRQLAVTNEKFLLTIIEEESSSTAKHFGRVPHDLHTCDRPTVGECE